MTPEARAWLDTLEEMGAAAKAKIAAGTPAPEAVRDAANATVENYEPAALKAIAEGLHVQLKDPDNSFAIGADLYLYSRSVIEELAS